MKKLTAATGVMVFVARAALAGAEAEGEFTVLNPGSQATRYWGGFGAGKSKVCATGRMVDTSDAVLMEFDHCRIGVMGFGGGDSTNLMMKDSRETGSHLVEFLKRWAEGKYQ